MTERRWICDTWIQKANTDSERRYMDSEIENTDSKARTWIQKAKHGFKKSKVKSV